MSTINENKSQTASLHHSFDIDLAAKYSIEEALLIHHFQHWITINRELKRNFHDGRYWTYQSLDEIAAHFPYLSKSQVVDILEKLCCGYQRKSKSKTPNHEPILMKGNFNKSRYDRTVWYAFVNENQFLGDAKTHIGKSQNGNCDIPTPIPDSKTDSKTDTTCLKENIKEKLPEKRTRAKEEKTEVAAGVWITPRQKKSFEEDKLKGNFAFAETCYRTLSEWKISKEIIGGNDYQCLISWVIKATEEKCQKKNYQTGSINSKQKESANASPERPLPQQGLIMKTLLS